MNVLLTDYKEGSKRNNNDACDIDNKNIRKSMKEKYDERLFRSVDDIYMNSSGDRQFYTMPNTSIPNNQDEFARSLYDIGDRERNRFFI